MVRRYRWALSFKAKLLILLTLLVLGLIILFGVYPFLALTEPVDADVLVVEGWVHPYAIEASAEEFRDHHYRKFLLPVALLSEEVVMSTITRPRPALEPICLKRPAFRPTLFKWFLHASLAATVPTAPQLH